MNKEIREQQDNKEIKLDKKIKEPLWLSVLTVIMTVYDFIAHIFTSVLGIIFAIIIFLICLVGFIRRTVSPFDYYYYSSAQDYSCLCEDISDIHLQTDDVVVYL